MTGPILDDSERSRFIQAAKADSLVFERLIQVTYSHLLHLGDVAVDGGACEGWHTFPMAASVGPAGRVYAIEAVPTLAAALTEQASKLPQVTVISGALYRERTTLDFNYVRNDRWRSGLQRADYPEEPDIEVLRVDTVTLDDVLRDAPAWRFGKFDLEGGEFHAFEGGAKAIARLRPFLIFEYSPASAKRYGYAMADFHALMERIEYRVFDMFGQRLLFSEGDMRNRGWYAIGVAADSSDEAFLGDPYPMLLRAVLSEAVAAA